QLPIRVVWRSDVIHHNSGVMLLEEGIDVHSALANLMCECGNGHNAGGLERTAHQIDDVRRGIEYRRDKGGVCHGFVLQAWGAAANLVPQCWYRNNSGSHIAARTGMRQIVVIGASSGGLEAVSSILERLPPDFPAPICVVIHMYAQSPPDVLPSVLKRSTRLRVVTGSDGAPLKRGSVYV